MREMPAPGACRVLKMRFKHLNFQENKKVIPHPLKRP